MDSLAQDPISIHQFAYTSVAMPGPFCYPSIDMTQCKVTQPHPVRPAPIPSCDATTQLQQPKLRLTHAGIDYWTVPSEAALGALDEHRGPRPNLAKPMQPRGRPYIRPGPKGLRFHGIFV